MKHSRKSEIRNLKASIRSLRVSRFVHPVTDGLGQAVLYRENNFQSGILVKFRHQNIAK